MDDGITTNSNMQNAIKKQIEAHKKLFIDPIDIPLVYRLLAAIQHYPFRANSKESQEFEQAYHALPDYVKELSKGFEQDYLALPDFVKEFGTRTFSP